MIALLHIIFLRPNKSVCILISSVIMYLLFKQNGKVQEMTWCWRYQTSLSWHSLCYPPFVCIPSI